MNFLSVFTHARNRCFVTPEYVTDLKAMHTASTLNILLEFAQCCSNVLERFVVMTDRQATCIDVVTFDFEDARIRCIVYGSIDYQMSFV